MNENSNLSLGFEIAKALNLKNAKRATINLEACEVATLTVEYNMTEDQTEAVSTILKKYHLVPLDEVEEPVEEPLKTKDEFVDVTAIGETHKCWVSN